MRRHRCAEGEQGSQRCGEAEGGGRRRPRRARSGHTVGRGRGRLCGVVVGAGVGVAVVGWRLLVVAAELRDDGLQAFQCALAELWEQVLCAAQLVCHGTDVNGIRRVDPASIGPELRATNLIGELSDKRIFQDL